MTVVLYYWNIYKYVVHVKSGLSNYISWVIIGTHYKQNLNPYDIVQSYNRSGTI